MSYGSPNDGVNNLGSTVDQIASGVADNANRVMDRSEPLPNMMERTRLLDSDVRKNFETTAVSTGGKNEKNKKKSCGCCRCC
jgi:hypothetical protein